MKLFNRDRIRKDYLLRKVKKQFKAYGKENLFYIEGWNESLKKVIDIIEKSKN